MKNPSPIEIAQVAAPIYAAFIARKHGSMEDAVNEARKLIEAAKAPKPAGSENRLLSTRGAAKEIYGFQKNLPHNWRNQFRDFCVEKWDECFVPALSSSFTALARNGQEMFDFYDSRGWDASFVAQIRLIYRAYRTQASRHKIKTKPEVQSKK